MKLLESHDWHCNIEFWCPFSKLFCLTYSCTLETPVLDLANLCEELIFSKFPFLVLRIHSLILTPSLACFYVASWCFQINWQLWLYLSSFLTITLHYIQNVPYSYRFFSFHCILYLYWNSCSWLNLLHCSGTQGVGFFQCFIAGIILILSIFFYCWTVHSDIHTVHSPTEAHLLQLWLQFTLKLDGSYVFRSTTIIRELAIEPG